MNSLIVPTSTAEDEITDYCGQVCGGGHCGTGPICQYGINTDSHMPQEARTAKLYPFNPGDYDRISIYGLLCTAPADTASIVDAIENGNVLVDNETPDIFSIYAQRIGLREQLCIGIFTHLDDVQNAAQTLSSRYGWPLDTFVEQPVFNPN